MAETPETLEMEPIACPLCARASSALAPSATTPAAIIYRDRIKGIANEFAIVRCAGCGLAYTNPAPTPAAVARHYSSSSVQAGLNAAHRRHSPEFLRSLCAQRMKTVEGLCPPGKLLDVGCGFGEFAAFAGERGWTVFGSELSPERAKAARDLLGTDRVFDCDVDRIPGDAGPFDVITAFHVLEHVSDPLGFLGRLRDLLAPAGRLVVEVPNLGCLRVRLRKRPLANQLHITHFEPATLRAALDKAGFDTVRITGADNKGAPPSPVKRALRRARLGLEETVWRLFGAHIGTNLRAVARKRPG